MYVFIEYDNKYFSMTGGEKDKVQPVHTEPWKKPVILSILKTTLCKPEPVHFKNRTHCPLPPPPPQYINSIVFHLFEPKS